MLHPPTRKGPFFASVRNGSSFDCSERCHDHQLTRSIGESCGRYIHEVQYAQEDIVTLQRAIVTLEGVLQKLRELLQYPNDTKLSTSRTLADDITSCLSVLRALDEKIDPGKGKTMMSKMGLRALKWPLKRPEVERVMNDVERYKSSFSLSLQVDQTTLIAGVAKTTEIIDRNICLENLPIARGAEIDSYEDQKEDECLPGTRAELLRQIAEWPVSPMGKCMFWLNDMAGTGKLTISRTVARSFKQDNLLGASFFFKRGEGDRNAKKLFPTIARNIMSRIPQLERLGIQKAISDDPDIAGRSLREQFEKLLLQPLLALEISQNQTPTMVIVIDALDECEDDNAIRVILQLLPRLRELNAVRLRIFLTSRPELPIRLGFSKITHQVYQDLVLHEIPEAATEHDISLFLKHQLSEIRKDRSLPVDWPGDARIQTLVALSVPLFIFATIICRVLQDPQWDPTDSLSEIITQRSEGSQLDGTYLPVLKRLLNKQEGKNETAADSRISRGGWCNHHS